MSNERYEQARQRVGQLKAFYGHLIIFALLNIALFAVDVITGDGWWFFWATLGWGIGLIAHALTTFAVPNALGGRLAKDWEERKIREYMDENK